MSGERRLHVEFILTWLLHSKLVVVLLLSRDTNTRREELHVGFLLTWLLHYKLVAVVLLSRDTNTTREETTCRIPTYMVSAF